MKRRSLGLLTVLAVVLVMTAAVPASASPRVATGTRLSTLFGNQSYPANTAFNFAPGFSLQPDDPALGRYLATLEVDGAAVTPDFKLHEDLGQFVDLTWVFNFPRGMTGTHAFTSHYWAPCGSDHLPCGANPMRTPLEIGAFTTNVTFTP